ncbi:MAG: T9SS type A sorting domain-containing protein [Flavobacteriaceae bacterium]|nr:T9SS type A sorting domain-containing protein [Flavobacteriaceae bacterium]
MKRTLLLLLFLFASFFSALSQEGRTPLSWQLQLGDIPPIELPPIDLEAIAIEDSINDLDKTLPWRYGVTRPIILDFQSSGVWTVLEGGAKLWRIAIKSPEALNMGVNFDRFRLPEGATLQMYNQEKSDFSKVYTQENNRNSNVLGSWFIEGEIIVVEYFQPANTSSPAAIEIGSVIHGYRMGRVRALLEGERGLGDSGDCNYDVNCSVGSDFESKKDILKKTVALLNLGNGHLCSASLINNTSLDKKPYLLTANHCLENSDPAFWSVRFNWVSPNPVCGEENDSGDIQSNFTMSGAELKAHNATTDFALVELFNPIPSTWDVAFAGWDNSDTQPQFQVGIHHPNGDIMKICRDNDRAVKDDANGVQVWLIKGVSSGDGNGWEIGTTESGSSGSPLFSDQGRIIGQLYAGQSFCNGIENNNDYDIYGRLGISWNAGTTPETRLRDWLDPIQTGQNQIDAIENSLTIGEFEFNGELLIYPNPASNEIMIMNMRYPNLSYRFFNMIGQELKSGSMSNSENRLTVENYPEGIYFLYLIDEDTKDSITKKVIISR